MNTEDRWIFTELFVGGIVVLQTDFEAVSWLGIWQGLNKRRAYQAVLLTAVQLLGPCWLMIFFLFFAQPRINGGGVAKVFAFWFGVGIVVDVIALARARARLLAEFREVASRRYDKAG